MSLQALSAGEGQADDGASLAAAIAGNGISIVGGSSSFVGITAQSATFAPSSPNDPVFGNRSGILLTTGSGAADNSPGGDNTNIDIANPIVESVYAGDQAIATNGTTNQNELAFDFTLASGFTGIEVDIAFGTDAAPALGADENDPFAILLNGSNIAVDGGTPIYQRAVSDPANFFAAGFSLNTNQVGTFYDGVSSVLTLTAMLAPGTHSFAIGIADIGGVDIDSGVFVSNLRGVAATSAPVPLPAPAWLLLAGLASLAWFRRRAAA